MVDKHHWGTSRTLYVDDNVQLDECHGLAGGASSMHWHNKKNNLFHVHGGIVEIYMPSPDDGRELLLARLLPGHSWFIPAGQKHRMLFVEDSDLIEVYTAATNASVDLDDIHRCDEGKAPGTRPAALAG